MWLASALSLAAQPVGLTSSFQTCIVRHLADPLSEGATDLPKYTLRLTPGSCQDGIGLSAQLQPPVADDPTDAGLDGALEFVESIAHGVSLRRRAWSMGASSIRSSGSLGVRLCQVSNEGISLATERTNPARLAAAPRRLLSFQGEMHTMSNWFLTFHYRTASGIRHERFVTLT